MKIERLVQTKTNVSGTFTVNVDSFFLRAGEMLGVKGASGSGKTTLLETLTLIRQPASCESFKLELPDLAIDLAVTEWQDDVLLDKIRGGFIGFVNQQISLLPYFNVQRNIEFPTSLKNTGDSAWLEELLESLQLDNLSNRYPDQPSLGQKQRVVLARALYSRPKILLLDEPTSALNDELAEQALVTVNRYIKSSMCGCVVVSHDTQLLAKFCDRDVNVVVLRADEYLGEASLQG